MAYLHRRIEHLHELVKAGRLHFLKGDQKQEQLAEELTRVRRLESGEVDLQTCSPLVRSFARMIYNAEEMLDSGIQSEEEPQSFNLKDVTEHQREYFALLDDVFRRIFGKTACDFASPHEFVDKMKKSSGYEFQNLTDNYRKGLSEIHDFHAKHMDAFAMPKCLHGLKLVLGGTSRFTSTHLGALRQTMLYADTFLIPDPVLPWLEEEREEERFNLVQPLVQMHTLLHLKPLIDADLPYPAVVVFPSFERLLMKHDAVTMDGIDRLMMDFFAHYLGLSFENETEIVRYAVDNESEFLNHVEEKALFVAPGERAGTSLEEMLSSYRREIQTWRDHKHIEAAASVPDGILVLQGIMERLQPQYHVRENAKALGAHPMMCMEAHAHYFKLCADVFNESLVDSAVISAQNLSGLQALQQPQFRWLTNVPIEVLAKLRADGENENFRHRIAEYVRQLNESNLDDLDAVSYEVHRGIQSLLREHDKSAQALESKYQRKFGELAVVNLIGFAPLLYPALAPFIGTVAVGTLSMGYIKEKIEQLRKRRQMSQSLTGVLAKAQDDESN